MPIMFSIVQWNANSIKNKLTILNDFINKNTPSIISINESKTVSKVSINNYNTVQANYKSNSGGLITFIHESYQYEEIKELNEFKFEKEISDKKDIENKDIEILATKIHLGNTYVNFVNEYMRPNKSFLPETFILLLKKYKNLILAGDFNCKSPLWFSSGYNSNGEKLEEMLEENDLNVIKCNMGTRFDKHRNTYEVLDLFIVSPNLELKVTNIRVDQNFSQSDHFPIILSLNIGKKPVSKKNVQKSITNWEMYKEKMAQLCSKSLDSSARLEEKIESLVQKIHNASKEATLTVTKKVNNINLPKYILDLIDAKNQNRKIWNKYGSDEDRQRYNKLTKIVDKEIKSFKNKKFENFTNAISNSNPSSKVFWHKLKVLDGESKAKKEIPFLKIGEKNL